VKIVKLTTHAVPPRWLFLKVETDVGGAGAGAPVYALLRERDVGWMPFADTDIRIDLACEKETGGHWSGAYNISIEADSLRRPGLYQTSPQRSSPPIGRRGPPRA
jgi:hypothetical protein